MENRGKNYTKKICKLYYQDKIWELAKEGKSVREITELINRHYIPRSRFKGVTLSKSTIHKIVQKDKTK